MEPKENTKKITREYRMAQWTEIMRKRAESGLSIVKYCAREGMPPNRYHYWQRRLRAASSELMPRKIETVAALPSGWTEVRAVEDTTNRPKSSKETGVTIEIGKCRVAVENTSDMELLTKVCKALVSLC